MQRISPAQRQLWRAAAEMPVSIRHQNRTCHKTQFILMFCVVLLLPLSQLQLLDATRCHCTVRRAGSLFFFFFFHSNSPRSEQRIASHRIAPLPPYLSVLFNAQQRSDVSCARFLKCTIIPGPGPAPSPAFRIASHRVVSWHPSRQRMHVRVIRSH